MTKGERFVQRYEIWEVGLDMDMDKEGTTLRKRGGSKCNIKEKKWITILGQEKHTSRGSKLMNLVCLHLICAYSCAYSHCISFKFNMHACMVYASYRT